MTEKGWKKWAVCCTDWITITMNDMARPLMKVCTEARQQALRQGHCTFYNEHDKTSLALVYKVDAKCIDNVPDEEVLLMFCEITIPDTVIYSGR